MATRQEHLEWCKKRALEYVDRGDHAQAFASFASDVSKHPETASLNETINGLGMPLLMAGHLDSGQQMRHWINGFN